MVEMNTHDMPEVNCPNCGTVLDAATNTDSTDSTGRPDPGDITICLRCGHLMAFDEQLRLRELNDEEIKMVAGDRRLLAVQKARARVVK